MSKKAEPVTAGRLLKESPTNRISIIIFAWREPPETLPSPPRADIPLRQLKLPDEHFYLRHKQQFPLLLIPLCPLSLHSSQSFPLSPSFSCSRRKLTISTEDNLKVSRLSHKPDTPLAANTTTTLRRLLFPESTADEFSNLFNFYGKSR